MTFDMGEMMRLAKRQYGDRPARLEVGADAETWLLDTLPRTTPAAGELGDPFGVPIVRNGELSTRAWRVVDAAGETLSEGVVPR